MSVSELIHRRRRQVLVHSIAYYGLDSPTVTDVVFDGWAHELAALQATNPEASAAVAYMREEFADFDGSTGHHLPLTDPGALRVARDLIQYGH